MTARTAEPLAETVQLIERTGGRALAVPGDVSAPDAVARVVTTAKSQLGMVDILVNNARAVGPLGYDWEVDVEDWWRTFEVNMRGPFLYARAVLPGMVKRRRGRIVNSLLSQGRGVQIERSAQMLLFLASGRADALSGRFIRAQDDEEELVRRTEEIRRDDLHVVTLRT